MVSLARTETSNEKKILTGLIEFEKAVTQSM